MADISRDVTFAGVRAAPPLAVSAWSGVSGMGLQDWVFVATLVYLAVQIGYLLWKWGRDIRRARGVGAPLDLDTEQ